MPNLKVKNQYFAQECERIESSEIQNIDDFNEVGKKTDGVSEGGVYSREVIDSDGNKVTKKYMLKAMDPFSMASEYIGANVARLYIGDSAPVVDLVRGKDGKLFVASEFIDNFETLKSLSESLQLPPECFPYGCVVDGNGELQSAAPHLQSMVNDYRANYPDVQDAELVNIISDYIQHGDAHDRNVGVRGLKDSTINVKATSLIDFSWSLRNARTAGSEITYNPHYSHNYNPHKTIAAIDQVLEVTPKEIEQVTAPLFKNLEEFYGQDNAVFKEAVPPSNYPLHIMDLAQNAVQNALGLDWGNKQTLQEVKDNMISSLEERSDALVAEKQKLQDEILFDQMWKESQDKGVDFSSPSSMSLDSSKEYNPQISSSFNDYIAARENLTDIPHVTLPQSPALGRGPEMPSLPTTGVGQAHSNLPDSVMGGIAVVSAIQGLRKSFSGNTATTKKTNKSKSTHKKKDTTKQR